MGIASTTNTAFLGVGQYPPAGVRGAYFTVAGEMVQNQRLASDAIGAATLTLENLQAGSDIVVLLAGTETAILEVDANPGSTYDWLSGRYVTPRVVDIGVFKSGFVPFYVRNYTLYKFDATLPIAQVADRNYRNPT